MKYAVELRNPFLELKLELCGTFLDGFFWALRD